MLVFFVIVALFMVYNASKVEQRTIEIQRQNVTIEENGKALQALKSRWKNPEHSKKVIDGVLSDSSLAGTQVVKAIKKGIYIVNIENLEPQTLDRMVNKLFNESVAIKKISIEKISEHNATVQMECQL